MTKAMKPTAAIMTMTLMAAAAGILLAVPTAAAAQEQIGCFRGKPLPACRTFWIFELQGVVPLAQTTRTVTSGSADYPYVYQQEAFETAVEWNVGHMVNVGNGYAVGGLLTVGSGGEDPLTGIRLRGRKWLTDNLSVELGAGVLRADAGGAWDRGIDGWTSDLRLNIRDQGSFFLRYDGVSVEASSYAYNNYFDPGGLHHGFSVGASAGSIPALIGTGSLGALYAILLAVYVGSD